MKRNGADFRIASSFGSVSMSSRWISTSLSGGSPSARPALIVACTALTSDDLPMPRAPHRSALLAGRPAAKRCVLSARMSRTRSTPRINAMSTRLTRWTGSSAPVSADQTKQSAAARSVASGSRGASRATAAIRRSSFFSSVSGSVSGSVSRRVSGSMSFMAGQALISGRGQSGLTCPPSGEKPAPAVALAQPAIIFRPLFTRPRRGRLASRLRSSPLLRTPPYAQAVGGGLGILVSCLPFVLILVFMYFLFIRPQRTQMKKRGEMLAAIRRGDTVVTGGGLFGKVTKGNDDYLEVDLGNGVK